MSQAASASTCSWLGCTGWVTDSRLCPSPFYSLLSIPQLTTTINNCLCARFVKTFPVFGKESRNESLLLPSPCKRGEGCGVRPGSLLFATHSPSEQRVVFQGSHAALHTPPQCSWTAKKYLICHTGSLAQATLARSSILLFLTRQPMPLQLGKRHHYNRSQAQTSVPARSQQMHVSHFGCCVL